MNTGVLSNFSVADMAIAECGPITGIWSDASSGIQEEWSGAKPPEAERSLVLDAQSMGKICPFSVFCKRISRQKVV